MNTAQFVPKELEPGYWTETRLKSEWNYKYEPNQLFPELLAVQSLCPWPGTVSSSRAQMFGSHIGQRLLIKRPTIRRIQTGLEAKYGKATFNIQAPANCSVVDIIHFYNANTKLRDDIKANPESIVVVEYATPEGIEIGYMSMTEFCSNHPYFGFRYRTTEAGKSLYPKKALKKGTVLLDSPAVDPDGNYRYGIQLPTYFATIPSVAEDGILIAESIREWLTVSTFDKKRGSWGSNTYPINLYGDEKTYKPFPEIGDRVRPDALLMAFRKYEGGCCPVEMSRKATMEHSATYDSLLYADGPGGTVIDIRVYKDGASQSYAPDMCNEQAIKYDKARREFYEKILKLYNRLDHNANKKLRMSPEFSNLVETAIKVGAETAQRQHGQKKLEQRIQNLHRGAPMDDWVIEFVIQYDRMPVVGGKLTDTVGGKGVIVKICPDEDMPIDEHGNRALVVMDSNATISRMNIARFYEQYFNACSRDLTKEICEYYKVAPPPVHGQKMHMAKKMEVARMFREGDPASLAIFDRLIRYFEIIVPIQKKFFEGIRNINDRAKMAEQVIDILEDGIYLHHPTDNDPELHDVITQLKAEFPAKMSKITYRGNSGKMRTTKDAHLIGDVYFMLLEKTGGDWSAVSSAKVQGFGTICQLTNQDKNSSPVRRQGIRAYGETEIRIILACLGPYITNVLLDRNNNLEAHKFGVKNILRAQYPTNIRELVDYNQVTLGGSRSLELVHHLLFCGGIRFTYEKYQESYQKADFSGLAV